MIDSSNRKTLTAKNSGVAKPVKMVKLTRFIPREKKGIVYMLISSFFIVILLVVFLISTEYRYQDQETLYQSRIRTMNDFVRNFNTDVHRATYIAAFRTLIALEDTVTTKGIFLSDIDASFRETFYYGTINGSQLSIMDNSSFEDYVTRVSMLADDIGLNISVNVTQIRLSQPNPWSIDVEVFADINITDKKKLASWIYRGVYLTNVPIYDLRDPVYGAYTYNKAPNTIRTLNTTDFVTGTDTGVLQSHINGSYYVASPNAPSFIMRFEGNLSADPNGIESIVNVLTLSDQELVVDVDRVKIDYIYFTNISTDKICDIQNVPSDYYFVIPSDRAVLYDVSGLNYSASCP